MNTYELKLTDGRVVRWKGKDGLDACIRYADAHPGCFAVIAWREPRVKLNVGAPER